MRTKIMCCFCCYLALQLKKYLQYSIGIATEQDFRYIELTDERIWISKNASLCRVLANRVIFFLEKIAHFKSLCSFSICPFLAIVSYTQLIISLYNYLHTHIMLRDKIFQGGSKYFGNLQTGGSNIMGSKYSITFRKRKWSVVF